MSVVSTAATLSAVPAVAAVAGAVICLRWRPSETTVSGIQHFAAGVVIAALAGELLPEVQKEGAAGWAALGFCLGVALMLGLGEWNKRLESRAEASAVAGAIPIGLVAAIAIDLLIDGSLVGLGSTLGTQQGIVLTVALTLEVFFVCLSLSVTLLDNEVPQLRSIAISASMAMAILVGAIGGAAVLGDASRPVLAAVLAFGAAALLYLVVEELLVEAHDREDTVGVRVLFFAGFLAVYAVGAIV